MAGSGLFDSARPTQARFIEGKGGVAGEVDDLRRDVKATFAPLAAITVDEFTNAAAGGTAALKDATATTVAPATVLAAGLKAPGLAILAAQPRNVIFTTAGGTAADAPATAVITGRGPDDSAQTETVTLAQTAAVATGVKLWKSITSIAYAAADGTGATVAIGIGDALPLSKPIKTRAGAVSLIKEHAAGSVVTNGAVATAAAAPPNGSYTPNSAPNGTNDYAVWYEYTP
jgi:hypothetical protein